jgi:hypothetical protein
MRIKVSSFIDANMSQATRLFFRTCLESSPIPAETSFRRPAQAKPGDGAQVQLHHLKRAMLQAVLAKTSEVGLLKRFCGAANEAAELAWISRHPLLAFPGLFEGLIQKVRTEYQAQVQSGEPASSIAAVCQTDHDCQAYLRVSVADTGVALRRSNVFSTKSAGRA